MLVIDAMDDQDLLYMMDYLARKNNTLGMAMESDTSRRMRFDHSDAEHVLLNSILHFAVERDYERMKNVMDLLKYRIDALREDPEGEDDRTDTASW